MLTTYGLNSFLKALGQPYSCRVYVNGGLQPELYPCDTGYPRLGDPDPINTNRGDNVLTWRYTIPRGTDWGRHPATEVELMDGPNIVERIKIPDLHSSANHPTVLYLNLMLRR